MQLSHMSDCPVDLKTQMQDLTRNTTDILLLEIPMIDNSNELYFDVKRITDMDWNDATGKERSAQRLTQPHAPLLSNSAG